MGIKFGEVDSSQILENEFRIGILEGVIDWVLRNNHSFASQLTPEVMDKIRQDVVLKMRQKYPNSVIEIRKGE